MDDIVRQAMAKWPHVPHCYGWLGLDARGNWRLRDEHIQALGPFDGKAAAARGTVLQHPGLIEFIGRNYTADASGCWYFQNGPQRVFVELQATPLVWRLQPDGTVHDHIGRAACVLHSLLDETGRLYLHTAAGLGLVHSQDMVLAAEWVQAGHWQPESVQQADLPQRFGFVQSPQGLNQATKSP